MVWIRVGWTETSRSCSICVGPIYTVRLTVPLCCLSGVWCCRISLVKIQPRAQTTSFSHTTPFRRGDITSARRRGWSVMWGDGRHPRTRQNNQQLGMLARELHFHVWKPDRTRSTLAGKTKTQKRNLDLGCHNCQHLLTDKGATGRSQRRPCVQVGTTLWCHLSGKWADFFNDTRRQPVRTINRFYQSLVPELDTRENVTDIGMSQPRVCHTLEGTGYYSFTSPTLLLCICVAKRLQVWHKMKEF